MFFGDGATLGSCLCLRAERSTLSTASVFPWLWPGGDLLCVTGKGEGEVCAQSLIYILGWSLLRITA